ncbi:MAG TPA: class I SAM-dependent methyltransferase [Acidimicrobiia bacterium]|jgi:SAM-dependent methyltransferase|nr:class I SAM-dependent methyltransferase [Acidimicrobiia bacterium]
MITHDDTLADDDLGISAQARALPDLDRMLDRLSRRSTRPINGLLDLGCGMGALTRRIGDRLGIDRLIGVDCDDDRLWVANLRGIDTHTVDLEMDEIPVGTGSVGLVTCFGVLPYLCLYDQVLGETARVLEDGGWFLFSMPNLASHQNRLAMLFGYQPSQVDVSSPFRGAGTLRRRSLNRQGMPPLLHAATLRCMRELLDLYGFDVELVRGFSPRPFRNATFRRAASHLPAWSRRFLILARKRPPN